jgi:hypothetical protein
MAMRFSVAATVTCADPRPPHAMQAVLIFELGEWVLSIAGPVILQDDSVVTASIELFRNCRRDMYDMMDLLDLWFCHRIPQCP